MIFKARNQDFINYFGIVGQGMLKRHLVWLNIFNMLLLQIYLKNNLQAPHLPNIKYLVSPSEQIAIRGKSVDLVVVAQALHWFISRLIAV
ncbi:MAG TPA: hypothetical protein VHE99_08400 [Gammaproteobacteria bacterium]|nr:hypothetical protein [Gammaproteobacteria bacterium]